MLFANAINSANKFFGPIGLPAAAFDAASLFAGGLGGGLYNPSVLTSLWQDSAGTVAGAVNSPVGRVTDLSGNGNHFVQATSSRRPILRLSGGKYWLEFDGIDDYMDCATAAGLSQPNVVAVAGYLPSVASPQHFFDGIDAANRHAVFVQSGGVNLFSGNVYAASTISAATPTVIVAAFNGASSNIVKNGVAGALGNAGASALIGYRLGAYDPTGGLMNGRIYGLIVRDTLFSAGELASVDTMLADLSGATL